MGDFKIEALPNSPAERLETVQRMLQDKKIDLALAKHLLDFPDMDPPESALTDDQLRAECERRGIIPRAAIGDEFVHRVAFDKAERERDEWKARAERAEAVKVFAWGCGCGCASVEFESREEMENHNEWHRANCTIRNEEKRKRGWMLTAISRLESGPGIARLPEKSQPLAFLDEDLLCEDA